MSITNIQPRRSKATPTHLSPMYASSEVSRYES